MYILVFAAVPVLCLLVFFTILSGLGDGRCASGHGIVCCADAGTLGKDGNRGCEHLAIRYVAALDAINQRILRRIAALFQMRTEVSCCVRKITFDPA